MKPPKSLGIVLPPGLAAVVKSKPKRSRAKADRSTPPPVGTRVLALDVSSTAAGVALVYLSDRGPVIESQGLSKPPAKWMPERRINVIVDECAGMVDEANHDLLIMEVTDGMTWGSKRRTSHLVQLAIAQGRVYEAIRGIQTPETVSVTKWARGVPKSTRAERIKALFPEYDAAGDPGFDVADAIGIALWRMGY